MKRIIALAMCALCMGQGAALAASSSPGSALTGPGGSIRAQQPGAAAPAPGTPEYTQQKAQERMENLKRDAQIKAAQPQAAPQGAVVPTPRPVPQQPFFENPPVQLKVPPAGSAPKPGMIPVPVAPAVPGTVVPAPAPGPQTGSAATVVTPSTQVVPRLPPSAPAPIPSKEEQDMNEIKVFKKIVEDSKKQVIQADKREFVELSRNYLNRFHCSGQIEKMIVPQDKGLEAELTNDGHDLFVRVGNSPNKQFPVDLSLVCDGSVFLVNAVVHSGVPSQEIELRLPKGMRSISTASKEKYQAAIKISEALPLEEKVSRIMQRVYQNKLLPYWREVDTPTSQSRWQHGGYSVFLQRVVKTEIDSMVAWDFVFRGSFPSSSFYDVIRKIVRGEITAFGKVTYEGHQTARVIVITRESSDSDSASPVKAEVSISK